MQRVIQRISTLKRKGIDMEQLLHTPEGVRDITNVECGKKLTLEKEIRRIFKLYGYHNIQTPTFEYFNVFSKEIGTIDSKELYKFFDREGDTLVLRPDITPGVARVAATLYGKETMPIRLCYTGNTFINHISYQGRLKENTQMGVELIGWDSYMADTEILVLVIESLLSVGLSNFQLSLGNVGFYNSIIEETRCSREECEIIRDFITNRNYFGLEEYLRSIYVDQDKIHKILMLDELAGGVEVLEKADEISTNGKAKESILRLKQIYETIRLYKLEDYITFDLSMSGGAYHYYTGITFRGYTFGSGDAIVRGGRYDHLLKQFGKDSPSIGFAFVIDELLNAVNRQKIHIPYQRENTIILYEESELKEATRLAQSLRKEKKAVELLQKETNKDLASYIAYGNEFYAKSLLFIQKNTEIQRIDLS